MERFGRAKRDDNEDAADERKYGADTLDRAENIKVILAKVDLVFSDLRHGEKKMANVAWLRVCAGR